MKQFLLAIIAALVLAGCTPALHKAVRAGDADWVRELLDAGADVNVRNSSKQRLQYTPLHWAAYRGDREIAELLISRGAELDAEDPSYSTPLYLAAEEGHLEVVKFLISKGAEVNVKSSWSGYTPLHRAAWGPVVRRFGQGAEERPQYKEIVAFLIAKGAEINARNNDGKTALDQATWSDNGETAALLRKHGGEHGTIDGAAYGGDIEAVKDFLANGVDVNVKGGSIKGTPLHLAALSDHKEIAELLIAKGANVNAYNNYAWTPLHSAALSGHKEIAELLIAKGANVNAKTDDGRTPLHLAVETRYKEVIELLIAKGVAVNTKRNFGEIPLHDAVGNGHNETIVLLIAKGADVNAISRNGGTALDWVIDKEIAALFRKHGGKTGAELKAEEK